MQDTTYHFMFRIGVFALARNPAARGVAPYLSTSDGVAMRRDGWSLAVALAERLPPGAVVIMFWHFEGGPVPVGFTPGGVPDTLAAVVDTLHMSFQQPNPLHVSFWKWGDDWQIDVLAHGATGSDSLAVHQLLRSIVFETVPVVSRGQAAELAFRALPADVRTRAAQANLPGFDVAISEADSIFHVTLRPSKSCEDETNALSQSMDDTWSYRVHRTGVVAAEKR